MRPVGKREFTLHTSRYLKYVEKTGRELTITHQNHPSLKLVPMKPRSIRDLAGTIRRMVIKGDMNDPVLKGFNEWSS